MKDTFRDNEEFIKFVSDLIISGNTMELEKPEVKDKIDNYLKSLSTYDIHQKYTTSNWQYVKESDKCGCPCCGRIFDASEISEDDCDNAADGGITALCPYCGMDCVVPDSKVELTPELLLRMKKEWFSYSSIEWCGIEDDK